jgi:hypothetical protein
MDYALLALFNVFEHVPTLKLFGMNCEYWIKELANIRYK